jgi:hypothetical protein
MDHRLGVPWLYHRWVAFKARQEDVLVQLIYPYSVLSRAVVCMASYLISYNLSFYVRIATILGLHRLNLQIFFISKLCGFTGLGWAVLSDDGIDGLLLHAQLQISQVRPQLYVFSTMQLAIDSTLHRESCSQMILPLTIIWAAYSWRRMSEESSI